MPLKYKSSLKFFVSKNKKKRAKDEQFDIFPATNLFFENVTPIVKYCVEYISYIYLYCTFFYHTVDIFLKYKFYYIINFIILK